MTLQEYVSEQEDYWLAELDFYKPQFDSGTKQRYINDPVGGVPTLEEFLDQIDTCMEENFSSYDEDDLDFDVDEIDDDEFNAMVAEVKERFAEEYGKVMKSREPYE
jgi:hypothetical protein